MKRVLFGIAMNALLFGLSVAELPLAAFAQQEGKGTIQQRKENQQDRIARGVENGSLTPRETARLEKKDGALNKEIRHDRHAGSGLSPKKRRKINGQQNRLSRDIHRQSSTPGTGS
jgi:hypothetical protein